MRERVRGGEMIRKILRERRRARSSREPTPLRSPRRARAEMNQRQPQRKGPPRGRVSVYPGFSARASADAPLARRTIVRGQHAGIDGFNFDTAFAEGAFASASRREASLPSRQLSRNALARRDARYAAYSDGVAGAGAFSGVFAAIAMTSESVVKAPVPAMTSECTVSIE